MIWVTVHASCMQLQISEPNPQSRFFSSDERRLCTNYSTQSSLHLHAVYGFTYYNYMYYMYINSTCTKSHVLSRTCACTCACTCYMCMHCPFAPRPQTAPSDAPARPSASRAKIASSGRAWTGPEQVSQSGVATHDVDSCLRQSAPGCVGGTAQTGSKMHGPSWGPSFAV